MAGLKKVGIILGLVGVVITCIRLIPVFGVFGEYLGLDVALGQVVDTEYFTAAYLFFVAITGWICATLGIVVFIATDRNASIGLLIGAAVFIGMYVYASLTAFNSPDVNVYDFMYFNIGPLHTGLPPIIEPAIYLLAGLLTQLGVRSERK